MTGWLQLLLRAIGVGKAKVHLPTGTLFNKAQRVLELTKISLTSFKKLINGGIIMRFSRTKSVIAMGLLLLLLVACQSAVPPARIAHYTVVSLEPLTGALSTLGEDNMAAKMLAAADVNAWLEQEGKDWRLELEVADTESTPDVALERLEDWFSKGARFFSGPQTSRETFSCLDFANDNQVLLVSQFSNDAALAIDDWLFRFGASETLQSLTMAKVAEEAGVKHLIFVWRDESYLNSLQAATADEAGKLGIEVYPEDLRYEPDFEDFTALTGLLNIYVTDLVVNKGVSLMEIGVCAITYNEIVPLMTAAAAHPRLGQVAWTGSDGEALQALTSSHKAAQFAASTGFISTTRRLEKGPRYDHVRDHIRAVLNREPDTSAYNAYDIIWALALAIDEAGYDSPAVKDILPRVTDEWTKEEGASGHVVLNEFGDRKYAGFDLWRFNKDMEWAYAGWHDSRTGVINWHYTHTIVSLLPLTGGMSTFGENSATVARFAAQEVNEWLQANNKNWTLKLEVDDTQTEPAVARKKMKSWHDQGVKFFAGPQASSTARECLAFANLNQILFISPTSTSPFLAVADDWLFRFCPADDIQGPVSVYIAKEAGVKHLIYTWRGDPWGMGDTLQRASEVYAKGAGMQIYAKKLRYNYSLKNFAAQAASLNEYVSDLVKKGAALDEIAIVVIAFEEIAPYMSAASAYPQLKQVKWIGSDGTANLPALQQSPEGAGFAAATRFLNPVNSPEVGASRGKVWAHAHSVLGRETDSYSYNTYDIIWTLAMCIDEVGYDSVKVKALLPEMADNWTKENGASGHVVLNAAGDRAYADYDLWLINDAKQWERVGFFNSREKKIEWDRPVY
jgi:branched-chain amino acid transport system substrate-binding protein